MSNLLPTLTIGQPRWSDGSVSFKSASKAKSFKLLIACSNPYRRARDAKTKTSVSLSQLIILCPRDVLIAS